MISSVGQKAITGIYIGGAVAVAPPALALLSAGSNVFKAVIGGLLLHATTGGQYNSAFNVLITSPRLWQAMLFTVPVGSAISAISALGFFFSEGRFPNTQDLFRRNSVEEVLN